MSLTEELKKIKKSFGDGILTIGCKEIEADTVLAIGSPSLDFCLYGGIVESRMIEFSGEDGGGKTTCAFMVAARYQKKELERNPESPRAILLVDNEGTTDPKWARLFGYDLSENAAVKTVVIRPEAQSAEEIFDMIIQLVKTGEIGLVILDSIASLVPVQILDKSLKDKQMGGISAALARFANTIVGLLRKYKTTFIGINQIRENLSGYGALLQTPGGRAWRHHCSLRLRFQRGDFFDEEGNKLKTSAESPAGNVIEVAVLKSKICPWDRKVGYMHLNYSKGIDIIWDTIDTAISLNLIDNSTIGSYIILDEHGEVIQKIRGKQKLHEFLETNLDIYNKLFTNVYKKLSQKDTFIKSFEEMLGISVAEKFNLEDKEILENE